VRLELGLKTSDRSKILAGRDGTPWPTSDQLIHLIETEESGDKKKKKGHCKL
jgi:hypothetical protein